MSFEIVHKATFVNQLMVTPPNRIKQILKKIEVLRENPHPDGDLKKKLQGYRDDVYRLRSGDYRVLYTFDNSCVTLLTVGIRKDVYRREQPVSEVIDLAAGRHVPVDDDFLDNTEPSYNQDRAKPASRDTDDELPVRVTENLLVRLRIPQEHIPELRACRTVDDLCAASVPSAVRERVFDAIVSPDLDQVLQKPSFVTGDISDLLRFVDGELLGFMLRLSPEQERLAYWSLNRTGPTLVRGGPGTGKSMIAMYRVQGVINQYRARGDAPPHILFATYTNALVAFTQQLLQGLLGQDAKCVTVRTADSIAYEIVTKMQGQPRLADETVQQRRLQEAIAKVEGNHAAHGLPQHVSLPMAGMLTVDYLLEEIGKVIEARELQSLNQYLEAPRLGRKVRLGNIQKRLVWRVYEEFSASLQRERKMTWHQLRRRATEIARTQDSCDRYDAVMVDEIQDLDPTALQLLITLCKNPNRVFLAADANQSIYGSTFRWSDVHESLQLRGRGAVLRTYYSLHNRSQGLSVLKL